MIGHRISWSFILLIFIILLTQQWKDFRSAALIPKVIGIYAIASVLLTINWLVYVWGVNAGFIVETSFSGYFINPLLSVLLGVIFLRERLLSRRMDSRWHRRSWRDLPDRRLWSPCRGSRCSLAFSFGFYGFV